MPAGLSSGSEASQLPFPTIFGIVRALLSLSVKPNRVCARPGFADTGWHRRDTGGDGPEIAGPS